MRWRENMQRCAGTGAWEQHKGIKRTQAAVRCRVHVRYLHARG